MRLVPSQFSVLPVTYPSPPLIRTIRRHFSLDRAAKRVRKIGWGRDQWESGSHINMPGISRRDEWRRAVALFGISIARKRLGTRLSHILHKSVINIVSLSMCNLWPHPYTFTQIFVSQLWSSPWLRCKVKYVPRQCKTAHARISKPHPLY